MLDVDRMAEAREAMSIARTAIDDPSALIDVWVQVVEDNPVTDRMREHGMPDNLVALYWIDEAMMLLDAVLGPA
jgi:hypothetical protein